MDFNKSKSHSTFSKKKVYLEEDTMEAIRSKSQPTFTRKKVDLEVDNYTHGLKRNVTAIRVIQSSQGNKPRNSNSRNIRPFTVGSRSLNPPLSEYEIAKYLKKLKLEQQKKKETNLIKDIYEQNVVLNTDQSQFPQIGRGKEKQNIKKLKKQRNMMTLSEEGTPKQKTKTLGFWCRLAFHFSSLAMRMKSFSVENTQQTGLSEIYYKSANGLEEEPLFFDPALFARKQGVKVTQNVQIIASKSPEARTASEINAVYKCLSALSSFREKFGDEIKWNISRVATYTRCETGRLILRQGHYGYNFYFIYTGSVFIQKEKFDPDIGAKVTSTENILSAGDCFGEIAFIDEKQHRTASVICREPTELFQIDREAFFRICPHVFKEEMKEKKRIAMTHPLFQNLPDITLKRLSFESRLLKVTHSHVIDHDWSKTRHVYFVIKGKVTLYRKFNIKVPPLTYDYFLEDVFGSHIPQYSATKEGRAKTYDKLTKFAIVGELKEGDTSDMRILVEGLRHQVDPVIMVSRSVQILKVSVSLLQQIVPYWKIEHFVKSSFIPQEIPSLEVLYYMYLKKVSWEDYKRKVVGMIYKEKSKDYIALMSETMKGSKGWNDWPGIKEDQTKRDSLYQGVLGQTMENITPRKGPRPSMTSFQSIMELTNIRRASIFEFN